MKPILPSADDWIGWNLLYRTATEYKAATEMKAPPEIAESKRQSLRLLLFYGWKDVFKDNLIADKSAFRSVEDALRFWPRQRSKVSTQ